MVRLQWTFRALVHFASWRLEFAMSHVPSDLYWIRLQSHDSDGLQAQLLGSSSENRLRTGQMSWCIFPSVRALSGSEESIVTNSRQVRLATGIFPVVSLLNHSCSPNTSVSFTGTVASIRAAQHIRKGQEIVHCYGEPASFHGPALPYLKRIGAQEWAGPGPVPPLTYVLFWARAPAQLPLPSHDIPAFCWIGFDSLDVSGNCGGSLSRAAWESHGCCWEAVEAEFAVLLWL